MGLPFEGPADEVKTRLDTIIGTPNDLLTNLKLYFESLGYSGTVEDMMKAWLLLLTSASASLSIEQLLRLYLVSLGHNESDLIVAIRTSCTTGDLFQPVVSSHITDESGFSITDELGNPISDA